jgi:hypothetical protein
MDWGPIFGLRGLNLNTGPFRVLGKGICLEVHFVNRGIQLLTIKLDDTSL